MSPYQKTLAKVGLTLAAALGVWLPIGADEPPSAPARSASLPADRHLLLTNGQLMKGVVQEEETGYSVAQRAGIMRFPKSRVEGVFNTPREAYEYKLSQLPERDPDERMKLAHWCLNLDLKDEAREQLRQILVQNPSNPQAKAMLVSMDQAAMRLAMRQRDPEVQRTKAERLLDPERPRALDSAVIRNAQSTLGISNTPVIFDLPRPLAIRRTEEFVRFVHPLLQAYCAKCHNETYEGGFQLIPIKTKADRTTNALRSNLDATLRLVDPENPGRSELLSSTLRPHGVGGGKRPIFPGSNDRAYQVLASWVNRLVIKKNPNEPAPGEAAPALEPAESFAADRPRIGQPGANRPAPRGEVAEPSAIMKPRPFPAPATAGESAEAGDAPADDEQFPLPFAITGKKPKLPSDSRPSGTAVAPKPAALIPPPATIDLKVQSTATSVVKPPAEKAADPKAPAAKKKTPVKLDPAALERALQLRNQGRVPTP